jgi:dTDP-4-amino-4,6-dideoxygalactose transaminase
MGPQQDPRQTGGARVRLTIQRNMATEMYIPPWPGPSASQLSLRAQESLPYPLEGTGRKFFYVARNGIYHLFRALGFQSDENVLVPDYHSGNETGAIRAAGTAIRFYPIRRDLQPDREAIARLCTSRTRALYVIHFIGWPQPMNWITEFCQQRELLLIEDCALSFLSEYEGRPLGSFGDYAVHCLYKSLPVPNGAVLTQNQCSLRELELLETVPPSAVSVLGRSAELMLESFRSRFPFSGVQLASMKAACGRALTAAAVKRERVGNIGFDLDKVDTEMSRSCHWLLARFNYELIRERRRTNFLYLAARLKGKVSMLPLELTDGICPLFFPILAENKAAVAEELRRRGIGVVEFWNEGDPAACGGDSRVGLESDAPFLRKYVLELPIHQNVTEAQLGYIAREVLGTVRPVNSAMLERTPCCAIS